KIICSRTRRTPRDKSHPISGPGPTHGNKQPSPHHGRSNTNSGQRSRASTTFMATETSSAPARPWKNSILPNRSIGPPVASHYRRRNRRALARHARRNDGRNSGLNTASKNDASDASAGEARSDETQGCDERLTS